MRLFAKFLLLLVEATRSDAGRGLRFLQSTCPSTAADFGVVSGAISLLEFEYEVEYNRFDYRIGDILDVLEPKFVAFLLPTIFGTDCNGEGRDGQMSKYIGVSASPTDSPLGTTTCNQPVSVEGNTCQQFVGRITLYRKSTSSPLASTVVLLRDTLQTAIEEGMFDRVGGASRVTVIETNKPKSNGTICALDADGSYGDLSTNENRQLQIDFGYEMELFEKNIGTTFVLEKVEAALAKRLLPRLFPYACSDGQRRKLGRRLQGGVLGVSSSPVDVVEQGLFCRSRFDDRNICHTIHGKMTAYLASTSNEEDAKEQIRGHIQNLLDVDRSVRTADSSIIDIRYFNYDQSMTDNDSSTDGISGLDTETSDFPIWAYVVVAMVVALCCGTALILTFIQARDDQDVDLVKNGQKTSNSVGRKEHSKPEAPLSASSVEHCPSTPISPKKGTIGDSLSPQKSLHTPRRTLDGPTSHDRSPRLSSRDRYPAPGTPRTPRSVPTQRRACRSSPHGGGEDFEPRSVPTVRTYRHTNAQQLPPAPFTAASDHSGLRQPSSPRKGSSSHHSSSSPRRQPQKPDSDHVSRMSSSPRQQPLRRHSDRVAKACASPRRQALDSYSDHPVFIRSPDGKRYYVSPRAKRRTSQSEIPEDIAVEASLGSGNEASFHKDSSTGEGDETSTAMKATFRESFMGSLPKAPPFLED